MPKSNRDLCIEIIDSLPEEELAHVYILLKSVKYMSDEICNDSKNVDLGFKMTGDLYDLAEKLGIK